MTVSRLRVFRPVSESSPFDDSLTDELSDCAILGCSVYRTDVPVWSTNSADKTPVEEAA